MKPAQKTYHLFTMLMAILVVLSISLPSELLATHCDMDKQQQAPKSEIADKYCQLEAQQSTSQQNNKCNWTLSCACELNRQAITAEATPTITKTSKSFVVSVSRFIDLAPTDTPTLFTDTEFSPDAELPPIFLLNSVFLN